MSTEKQLIVHGLLGKAEVTYNGGGSLSTATDGIKLLEPLKGTLHHLHDGDRPPGPGTGGPQRRNVQRGRWFEGMARIHTRGAGAAYDDTPLVVPQDLDIFLRACGRKRTIDTTLNAEKVTYELKGLKADWASGVFAGYTRDEIITLTGAYASEKWSIDGVGPGVHEFTVRAAASIPTDAAVPAITYQNEATILPPVCESAVVNIGSYITPRIRKVEYEDGRSVSDPRPSFVATGGLLGFTLGRFKPQIKVTIEATPLVGSPYHTTAGINPTELKERATQIIVGVRWGAAASYNQMERRWPNAQLINWEEDQDSDAVPLWVLTLATDDVDIFEFLRGT